MGGLNWQVAKDGDPRQRLCELASRKKAPTQRCDQRSFLAGLDVVCPSLLRCYGVAAVAVRASRGVRQLPSMNAMTLALLAFGALLCCHGAPLAPTAPISPHWGDGLPSLTRVLWRLMIELLAGPSTLQLMPVSSLG